MDKYVCGPCGYVYDPADGDPDNGIDPGTAFENLPDDWCCPICGAAKDEFEKQRAGKPYKTLNEFETSPSGKLSDKDLAHYECAIHAAMEHFGIKEHE